MALTRRCSHHDILSWELVQIFYGDLNDNEQNMVDISYLFWSIFSSNNHSKEFCQMSEHVNAF